MKAVVVLMVLTLAGLGMAAVPAAAGDLKVGDQAPNFKLQASDGKTYQLSGFQGQGSGRARVVPEGVHAGLHDRVQVARRARRPDRQGTTRKYFMVSVDPLEGEKGNKAFAEAHKADFPLLSDPTKETANAYGVLNASAASRTAGRSTSARTARSPRSTRR